MFLSLIPLGIDIVIGHHCLSDTTGHCVSDPLRNFESLSDLRVAKVAHLDTFAVILGQ